MPHSRRIPVPMHVGFTESNSILNDGTPNKLKLRFTNLEDSSELDFSKCTIHLEFIIGSKNEDHILGDLAQVTGIQVNTNPNFTVTPPAIGAITDVTWKLSSSGSYILDSYSKSAGIPSFDIELGNIVSNAQIGTTYLFATISGVTGKDPAHPHNHVHYAPTKYKIDIQKANFKMIDDRLGIGTSDPRETLEIKRNHGNPVMTFHSANVASFKLGNDRNIFKIAAMDNGYGGHNGDFTANNVQVISLTKQGDVGIGIADPQAKLHVEGSTKIKGPLDLDGWKFRTNQKNYQLYLDPPRKTADNNFFLGPKLNFKINESFYASQGGNVGIGTTDPRESLEIKKNTNEGNPVMTFHSASVASFKLGNDRNVFKIAAMDNGFGGHGGNFAANDKQVISLTSKGLVGVGTTNPTHQLHIEGNDNRPQLMISDRRMWSNAYWNFQVFQNDRKLQLNAWDKVVGSFDGHNGKYSPSSDISMKQDIEPLTNMHEEIMRLKPVEYRFKTDPNREHKNMGFIAQDVEQIFPGLVTERTDGTKGLSYSEIIPVTVSATQELIKRVDNLNSENQILKDKIESQEKSISILQYQLNLILDKMS